MQRHASGSRSVWRSAAPIVIVCLAGLGVMLPQLLQPYAAEGRDFFHHILRLIALDQQVNWGRLRAAVSGLQPRLWLATLSYYPPLAYFLMEAAHLLGANFLLAYQVSLIIIVVGAALASYYLGARLFNRTAAVAVSIAYLYSPYFLMEVWTRSAVTVLLSLAVVPFLFAAIHRVTQEAGWRSYVETSLAAALIILAHPLTTFYYVPFLAAWALLCLLLMGSGQRWRAVLILAASAVTGVVLTSFYWLPVQLESAARRICRPDGGVGVLHPGPEADRAGCEPRFDHDFPVEGDRADLLGCGAYSGGGFDHRLCAHAAAAGQEGEGACSPSLS